MASASSTTAGSERGLLRKLHSLSGVVPLGAFVVVHVWITASIAGSRAIYDRQVDLVHSGVLGVLEPLLVLPLFFHALYGLYRALRPRDPDHAYPTDVMATLQRVSGVAVLVFVGLHLWELRAQTWTKGLAVSSYSTKLVEDLSSSQGGVPWIALGYVVGLAATCFHLVNGMPSFCATWGLAQAPAAERAARLVFRISGALLFLVSAGITVQLATGTRLFPASQPSSSDFVCGPEALSPPPPAHAIPAASEPHPASAPSASSSPGLPSGDR